MNWFQTNKVMPKEGYKIIGMDSKNYEHKLIYSRKLFWLRDMSMYVYFTPHMWKYDNEA